MRHSPLRGQEAERALGFFFQYWRSNLRCHVCVTSLFRAWVGSQEGSRGRERQRGGESREVVAGHEHVERGKRGEEPRRASKKQESKRTRAF